MVGQKLLGNISLSNQQTFDKCQQQRCGYVGTHNTSKLSHQSNICLVSTPQTFIISHAIIISIKSKSNTYTTHLLCEVLDEVACRQSSHTNHYTQETNCQFRIHSHHKMSKTLEKQFYPFNQRFHNNKKWMSPGHPSMQYSQGRN